MDEVSVRPVEAAEVETFLDCFERYWDELETFHDYPDPFSRDEYRRHMLQSRGPFGERLFWWIELDGQPAGFCVFTLGPHWYRQDVRDGYVDEFYIDPAFRRGHVGTAAARAMLSEFRRRGVRQVELSVLPRNSRARAFWTGLGFGVEMLRMALPCDEPPSEAASP